ncbi:MAG TPA: aldo/keto reductase [Phycisphaerae bacterium]|nr:aldo/keto reductase [Phycisphaerae bacterium]
MDSAKSSNAVKQTVTTASIPRRSFLQTAAVAGAGVAAGGWSRIAGAANQDANDSDGGPGKVPQRPFGRTGVNVSIMGIGGHAIGLVKIESEAIRIIHEAIDHGMTFMDNAWEYHDGRSEEWMGKALKGRRDQVFLMTKVCTHGRDAKVAMEQLEESLKRLQTDHLDLWQIHEVVYENDPDLHFARGGAVDAIQKAKEQGKVRFVGFTGHKDPRIHLKMLEPDFPFDAVQLPLNPFDAHYRSFQTEVLPELNKRGIAPIGMKSLGGTGEMIKKGALTIEEALRYVLSLPIATLVSGIDSLGVLRQNLDIATNFKPMNEDEMAMLREKCKAQAKDGRFELYKSSKKFDGPPGREQHGFPPPEKMAD